MKRNSGITLISLVVTIIVILILAGIAISLALGDNGVIKKANEAIEKQKVATMEEEVQMAWVGIIADRISTNLSDDQIRSKLSAALPNGTVDYASNQITYTKGDKTYYYFVGSDGGIGSSEYEIGKVLQLGNEDFYLIGADSNNYFLLAKYNINAGATAQVVNNTQANTPCAFSSTNYWSGDWVEGSRINLNNYTMPSSQTVSNNAIMKARAYGTSKGGTGRLMTVEEVEALGGSTSSYSTSNCPSWINSQNFWLGSAVEGISNDVWGVDGEYGFLDSRGYSNGSNFGVRPVVEISKSEI